MRNTLKVFHRSQHRETVEKVRERDFWIEDIKPGHFLKHLIQEN